MKFCIIVFIVFLIKIKNPETKTMVLLPIQAKMLKAMKIDSH